MFGNFTDKDIDSKSVLKTILKDSKLFDGIELTLHIICTAAVKVSVESVVESLVSRYEVHFDSKRQLSEEHALEEMEISENGPDMANADNVLASAMHKYWSVKSKDSFWHFCHKSQDMRTYKSKSKVVDRLLKAKPKFPFMN